MRNRKKKILDGIDREIIRILYKKSQLTSRKIARVVGLTDSAIFPRLNSLKDEGIIKISKTETIRTFERDFNGVTKKIKAPRTIHWALDMKK